MESKSIRKCLRVVILIMSALFIADIAFTSSFLYSIGKLTIQLAVYYLLFTLAPFANILLQIMYYKRRLPYYISAITYYFNSIVFFLIVMFYFFNVNAFSSLIDSKPLLILALINYIIQLALVYLHIIQLNQLIKISIGVYMFLTLINTNNQTVSQLYLASLLFSAYLIDIRNKNAYIRRYYDKQEEYMMASESNGVIKIENERFVNINKCLSDALLNTFLSLKTLSLVKETMSNDNIIKLLNKNYNKVIDEILGIKNEMILKRHFSFKESCDDIESKNLGEKNNDRLAYLKEEYIKYTSKNSNHKSFILVKAKSSLASCIRYKYTQSTNSFTIILHLNQSNNQEQQPKSNTTDTNTNTEISSESLFVSKIAHEFKNPLIAINELIDTLYETQVDTPLSDQQNKHFNLIQSFTLYLFTLAKDMECYSEFNQKKKLQLSFSQINIEDTIQFIKQISYGLISRHSHNKKISFDVIVDNAIPNTIFTDETRLRQILINLISNSIKFTDQGSIVLHLSEEDEALKFSVTDTGRGIDIALQKNIFLPFEKITKNNPNGSGLGLSIVRELSIALGQEIQFTSHLNHGSTFWFMIPLSNKEGKTITNEVEYEIERINLQRSWNSNTNTSTPQYIERELANKLSNFSSDKTISVPLQSLCFNKKAYFPQYPFQSDKSVSSSLKSIKTILIVDDEELVRKACIRTIKSYATKLNKTIDIIEAHDGFEAISYLCKSDSKKIDLIICDENMKYCNGTECFDYLNQLFNSNKLQKIPFVLLSGNITNITDTNANIENRQNIFKSYSKPINQTILQSLFSEINL